VEEASGTVVNAIFENVVVESDFCSHSDHPIVLHFKNNIEGFIFWMCKT
jgi:hypothetical protein